MQHSIARNIIISLICAAQVINVQAAAKQRPKEEPGHAHTALVVAGQLATGAGQLATGAGQLAGAAAEAVRAAAIYTGAIKNTHQKRLWEQYTQLSRETLRGSLPLQKLLLQDLGPLHKDAHYPTLANKVASEVGRFMTKQNTLLPEDRNNFAIKFAKLLMETSIEGQSARHALGLPLRNDGAAFAVVAQEGEEDGDGAYARAILPK